VESINPIVKVILRFGFISRLWTSTRKTIRTVKSARNMNKLEMESEDRDNPSIDTGRRNEVRMSEHSFDIFRINLNN
jgi:hypothetical protein